MLFNSLHFISSTTSVESYTVHKYAVHDAKLKDNKRRCEILQNPENVLGRYISTLYMMMMKHEPSSLFLPFRTLFGRRQPHSKYIPADATYL